MRREAYIVVATLGILALTLNPARVAADREHAQEIETALIGLDTSKARYLAAIERGDAETMVDLCTADVVMVRDGGTAVSGNRNVGSDWYEFFKAGNRMQQRLSRDHLEVHGDVATETGRYVAQMEWAGKPATVTSGRYALIWKREGFSWRCYRLFWFTSKAPAEPARVF